MSQAVINIHYATGLVTHGLCAKSLKESKGEKM